MGCPTDYTTQVPQVEQRLHEGKKDDHVVERFKKQRKHKLNERPQSTEGRSLESDCWGPIPSSPIAELCGLKQITQFPHVLILSPIAENCCEDEVT